ncbi:MAG: trypsin-like peptidase domain-containing protein [Myxococcota bacterium]
MQPALDILSCPLCQRDNSGRAQFCRGCGEPLRVSLVVRSPASLEVAQSLSARMAEGQASLRLRLESRLLNGRGMLFQELELAAAQQFERLAREQGVSLEIKTLRMMPAHLDMSGRVKPAWRWRVGLLGLGGVALVLVLLGVLYRMLAAPSLDAGTGWRSATLRAGRIVAHLGEETLPREVFMPSVQPEISPEVVASVQRSMVSVRTSRGAGSGFVVHERGLIVTSYHLIQDGGSIRVTHEGKTSTAQVERISPAWDLALLKVEGPLPQALKLADGARAHVLQPIFVSGMAERQEGSVRQGRISYVGRSFDATAMLELDMSLTRDHAGAPVMDAEGRVMGIVIAQKAEADHTAYAVYSNYLFDGEDALLRGYLPTYPVSETFLQQQLFSLAEVGFRLRERRAGRSDQAFVTSEGWLAVVVEQSDWPPGTEKFHPVHLKLRSATDEVLLDQLLKAVVVRPNPGMVGGGLYVKVQLEQRVWARLRTLQQARVELEAPDLALKVVLPLGVP